MGKRRHAAAAAKALPGAAQPDTPDAPASAQPEKRPASSDPSPKPKKSKASKARPDAAAKEPAHPKEPAAAAAPETADAPASAPGAPEPAAVSSLLGSLGALNPQIASLFSAPPPPPVVPGPVARSAATGGDGDDDSGQDDDAMQVDPDAADAASDAASGDAAASATDKKSRRELKRELVERNARTVFVGNLPVTITEKENLRQLKALFGQFGKIESIRFRSIAFNSKLPRKVAFAAKQFHDKRDSLNAYIVYAALDSVAAALALNGSTFLEKHIRVDRSEKTEEKAYDHKRSVFVGNLPFDVSDEALWEFFADCGEIASVRVIRDRSTNVGKGFGYVQFTDRAAVALALKLSDTDLAGRKVRITRSNATLADRSKTQKVDPTNPAQVAAAAATAAPAKGAKAGPRAGKGRTPALKVVEGSRASRFDKIKPKLTRVAKKSKPGTAPGATPKAKGKPKPKAVAAKWAARAKTLVAAEAKAGKRRS